MESAITEYDAVAFYSLLGKVYQESGYDFREYKYGTLMRRLRRRLHATGARTYLDYMEFLEEHPEEYQRLADEFTIKTSGFFRNRYAFQQVMRMVLPELVSVKREQGERELRFWSAACARGEEPYSIAIMLAEYLGHSLPDFNVSIHATDISREALEEAQSGRYSPQVVESIDSAVRESYFTCSDESYLVSAHIRQMVSFSYLDLVTAIKPPVLNVDCIFCCNVLIYLQRRLQERVLELLYGSLATPGYLVLGEVEAPTNDLREKLDCLDVRAKIYKKNRAGDKNV